MKFKESALAHKYLDGLRGLEIGGSAHNPFGLDTKNVDYTDSAENIFKKEEVEKCEDALVVDIVAPGDNLPVEDGSQDFVINSHVIEHFPDPIKALREWYRVVKEGGYVFLIVPHKERTFDRDQKRTTVEDLLERHKTGIFPQPHTKSRHYSFWTTGDFLELIISLDLDWKVIEFQDIDDKIGNGFTVLIKKEEASSEELDNIRQEIRKLKEKADQEEKRKFKRISQILRNVRNEFKRNGIEGIMERVKTLNKWE
ncbi:MAG TPA: hypothetical protein DCX32_02645 [Candidatus Moranbacteria bacterium]|nr:MAG: Methyltransferase type 11 [Parcubacteria group bacterium GW2011_GWC1_45_14]HAV11419.1 hypothetical protein [Candidatus Moranbacteria bacterium]